MLRFFKKTAAGILILTLMLALFAPLKAQAKTKILVNGKAAPATLFIIHGGIGYTDLYDLARTLNTSGTQTRAEIMEGISWADHPEVNGSEDCYLIEAIFNARGY